MEFTVEFYKSNVGSGREILLELTMTENLSREGETTLKRKVTKLARTIEPFDALLTNCPQPWDNHRSTGLGSYGRGETFTKRWTPFDNSYPLEGEDSYGISITRSAAKFDTINERIDSAQLKIKAAYEELTQKKYGFDPDTNNVDPEIQNIVGVNLAEHTLALLELYDGAERRIKQQIEALNNKE